MTASRNVGLDAATHAVASRATFEAVEASPVRRRVRGRSKWQVPSSS
jgi:hypothetical protein